MPNEISPGTLLTRSVLSMWDTHVYESIKTSPVLVGDRWMEGRGGTVSPGEIVLLISITSMPNISSKHSTRPDSLIYVLSPDVMGWDDVKFYEEAP